MTKQFRRSNIVLTIVASTLLSGCQSIGETLIAAIPMRKMGPYEIDPAYDQAAKALTPQPGQSLMYLILETDKNDCGSADVWLNERGLGRVFEREYLYASAAPGTYLLKVQDYRVDQRAQKQFFYTTTVPIELHVDKTSYFVVRADLDRRCKFRDLSVAEFSALKGRALLDQSLLSKLNDEVFSSVV